MMLIVIWKACHTIIDLGHDIGFHNDALRERYITGKNIHSLIQNAVGFLRDNGIKVDGTSAHGHRYCYEYRFLNYEIWSEFKENNNEGFLEYSIDTYSLADYGFKYETYFLNYEVYLSEAGIGPKTYSWYGYMANEVIIKFNNKTSGMFQLSIHPNNRKWGL